MAEMLILLAGLAAAAAYVLLPLFRRPPDDGEPDDDRDAAAVRHRVALEALRDVETDRRAGSLDDAAYAEQVAQAEQRAALTLAALDAPRGPAAAPGRRGRAAVLVAAGLIGAALLGGSLIPGTGIGNATEVNPVLAGAQEAESARQERIADLLDALAERSDDPAVISALADEYLAGSNDDDLVRAAVSLQLLIELEPDRADAYERIMSAYLRAGDVANARAAHDSYAELESADPVEVAFFDGLIALRGEGDQEAAVAAFDRFLELAPDDPRAGMIRGLRDEANQAGE
jgi:cytochrome c-type biogenesis protein CcmI